MLPSTSRTLPDVTGAHCRAAAVQGFLVRLAVIGVLAGLGLLLSAGCTDGMTTHVSMALSADPGMVVGVQQDHTVLGARAEVGTLVHAGDRSPSDRGGVLATCLAVIVLVLTAIARLRSTGLRIVVAPCPAWRGALIQVGYLRVSNLAELCVLRT